ncbi:unnamed protein product [Trypanosoma congolense IL3000]|uniref:WGS project CAEQ00000000 data, annotated contig 944 n=1 Tax=Trypanosoma congolense (strain IL3000) TaxID=1068625 RepID=F9WJS5_TRYCI|nr:unnamed protein product [Trypanosoma congolense IL3000]
MHHVASFLLSRITKLADVSPSNVESNLSERYIRMRNLKLREDTAADIIHLPVESGSIGELHFDLPWPLSSDPLVINVKDVHVSVLTCQPAAAADCPLDEVAIRSGITEETILGIGVNSALSRRTSSTRSQGSSLTPFKGIEIEEDTGMRGSWNEDENNGYMSCRSDGGSSSTCTEAEMDDSPLPNQRGGSVLSYVRDFFSSSMSWMFNRTVVVTLVGINIVFRPTTSCTEGF